MSGKAARIVFVKLAVHDKTGKFGGFFFNVDSGKPVGSGPTMFKLIGPDDLKKNGIDVAVGDDRVLALRGLSPADRAEADVRAGKGDVRGADTGVIAKAVALGKAAYHAKMKRMFVLDKDARALAEARPIGDTGPIMRAWYVGWDKANDVGVPVPEKATGIDLAQVEIKVVVAKVIDIVKAVAGRYGLATKIKNDNAIPAIVVGDGDGFIVTKIDRSAGEWNLRVVHGGVPVVSIMAKSHPALLGDLEAALDEQVGRIVKKLYPLSTASTAPHVYTFRYAFIRPSGEADQYHHDVKATTPSSALHSFKLWVAEEFPKRRGFYWLGAVDGKDIDVADVVIHDEYFYEMETDNPLAWSRPKDAKGEEGILDLIDRMLPLWEHKISTPGVDFLVRTHATMYHMLQGDAKERVTIKHKLTKLGVEYDKAAPLSVLKKLLATAEKEAEPYVGKGVFPPEEMSPEKPKAEPKPAAKPKPAPAEPPADLDKRIEALVKKLVKKDKYVGHITRLHKKQKELAATSGEEKTTVHEDLITMVERYEKLFVPKGERAAKPRGDKPKAEKKAGEKPAKTRGKKKQGRETAYQKEYKHAKQGLVKMVGEDVSGSRREDWHKYFGRTLAELEAAGVAGQVTIKEFLWPRPDLEGQKAKGKSAGYIYVHYKLWYAMAPKPTFDAPLNRAVYRSVIEYTLQEIEKVNDLKGIRMAVDKAAVFARSKELTTWNKTFVEHTVGKRFLNALGEYRMKDPRQETLGYHSDGVKAAIIIESGDGTSDAAYERLSKAIYEHVGRKESDLTKAVDAAKELHKLRFATFRERRWKFGLNITDKLRDTFGLRAVQLGQWVVGGEKVTKDITMNLTASMYGALWDLADVMGMDDKQQIALGHRLAVSLGARGSGKASAHYELAQGMVIINVTREYGNGAVAHEWGHFLDHHVIKSITNTLGINKDVKDFGTNHHINTARVQAHAGEPSIGPLGKYRDIMGAWNSLVDVVIGGGFMERVKRVTGPYGGYWANRQEIFARAFEAYVYDKLPAMDVQAIDYKKAKEILEGTDAKKVKAVIAKVPTQTVSVKNPYLVRDNRNDNSGHDDVIDTSMYPQGEERRLINKAFDNFFAAMKGKWNDVFPDRVGNEARQAR